jgi:hypothetical protein
MICLLSNLIGARIIRTDGVREDLAGLFLPTASIALRLQSVAVGGEFRVQTVFARIVVLAIAAISFDGCGGGGALPPLSTTASASPSSGEWQIMKSVDSVTGQKSVNIKLLSDLSGISSANKGISSSR